MKEVCENCTLKKRKCGSEKPICCNCKSIGINCIYPDAKRRGRSQALEDRLRKLEAIVDSLNLDDTTGSEDGKINQPFERITNSHVIPASPSPTMAAFPSHVDALRPDLEELFLSTGASNMFLNAEQIKRATQESIFFRFVIYALASLVAPASMVNCDYQSRIEMAEMYFKRSESFIRRIFRKPSYHGVLGLYGLVVYCTSKSSINAGTDKGPEAFYYYTVSIRIALSIGLNSEKAYNLHNLSEEQKEVMRCTWWSLYMGDRIMSALRYEPPLIDDLDCKVQLPNLKELHPQDFSSKVQITLMSTKEWYIPSPRNYSPTAYLIILLKIHNRIIKLSQEIKDRPNAEHDYFYRENAISGSLRDWYAAIPNNVRNAYHEISKPEPPTDPKATWYYAYIMIIYHCVRIYSKKRIITMNIQENVTLAASSSAAREIFLASCDLTAILQGFSKHNSNFYYVPSFLASCVFGAGLMIMVISRLQLNSKDLAVCRLNLQTAIACLGRYNELYNHGYDQKRVLEKLSTCHDPVLLLLALKSLRNLKGDFFTQGSDNMLSVDPEVSGEDVNLTFHPYNPSSNGGQQFKNAELLESVAQMANPFSDLMMGVSSKNEISLEGLFRFPT
jgi:hypothetical protein